MTDAEKTATMRLQTLRHLLASLAREWADTGERMQSPYARKWYKFFGEELARELKKIDSEVARLSWISVDP